MYATLNDDASAAMKQITGTPGGGAQHSQASQFKNRKPTMVKKAQMTSRTAPAPTAKPVSGPKKAISSEVHDMLKQAFPKQYRPEIAQKMYDFLQSKTGNAVSYLKKLTGRM